jgi:hypothetical protein
MCMIVSEAVLAVRTNNMFVAFQNAAYPMLNKSL